MGVGRWLLHRYGVAVVRLTPSNRFARFPTEWQTLLLKMRLQQADWCC